MGAPLSPLGGHRVTNRTLTTDYLVVGADAGSKLEKARSLGVADIGLAELYALAE